MERRKEVRYQPNQEVQLTVLTGAGRKVDAKIIDFSGRGISLVVYGNVAVGEAVRIDLEDCLLLGEICHSRADGGTFVVGIKMSEVVPAMSSLSKLVGAILSSSPTREPALVPKRPRVPELRLSA